MRLVKLLLTVTVSVLVASASALVFVLIMRGRITARQFVEASRMIRPGRRLGAILV